VIAGARWNRRLVVAARQLDPSPGLALELLAIAAAGGGSIDRARETVSAVLASAGLGGIEEAEEVLGFARSAGVPVAALLRAEAEERRRDARAAAQQRAAALGTRLLLPLGVCILPAFVLVGVLPVIVAIVSSTLAAF